MFNSILKDEITSFLELLKSWASDSYYAHSKGTMREFDTFLCDRGIYTKNIPIVITDNWVASLKGASRTVIEKAILIRKFFQYLNQNQIYVQEPTIPIERRDYVAYLFSEGEIDRIFAAVDDLHSIYISRKKNTLLYYEMPVILRILAFCGTRIGETLRLKVKDVDFDNDIIYLTHDTKNGKQRLLPIHHLLSEQIQQYCLLINVLDDGEKFLFPFSSVDHYTPISSPTISIAFRNVLKRLHIRSDEKSHKRGPCIHCLRHYFAFQSFRQYEAQGHSTHAMVPYLSIYMGHTSLDESSKYLQFHTTEYPEMYELFDSFSDSVYPEVMNEQE